MTVINDYTNYLVPTIKIIAYLMVIFGFILLVFGLFVPYDDYNGELGLKIVLGGGIIMITGGLLAIEQKIPSTVTPKE
ncbi:MAG: hypothetical protein GPJ54_11440 [Candidatus Heimdallarchaeota archaeon]|nr:hypothetical protein [Candidatus Heimdallarchaeota archaeon]